MAQHAVLEKQPMARPKRNDVSVKIEEPIYRKAKRVALERDITLAEYLSDLLRKAVDQDFDKVVHKEVSEFNLRKKKED